MIVIGIAGGVASGKSFVAQSFKKLEAQILDADIVGHEVLREPEVKDELRQRWGSAVFDNDGEVNRSAVAKIVFAKTNDNEENKELAWLEKLVHPRISKRLRATMDQLASNQQTPAVILDAAVMFKAGWDQFCDKILFVDVPKETRLMRARERGWSDESFEAREDSQQTLEFKRNRADVVIDNSGSLDETLTQIKHFWDSVHPN